MSTIITRHFASIDHAEAAAKALGESDLTTGPLTVIDATKLDSVEAASAALQGAGVPADRTGAYVRQLSTGGAVLVATAFFGMSGKARATLAEFNPSPEVAADIHRSSSPRVELWSESLGIPLLLKDPTPLSNLFGLETIEPNPRSYTELVDNPTPLSSWFGLAVLSRRQTSTTRLLTNRPGPLSRLFGLPLLSRRQNSTTRLSNNPTPLSSLIGMKKLSKNPTPLSSLLGLKVLSGD